MFNCATSFFQVYVTERLFIIVLFSPFVPCSLHTCVRFLEIFVYSFVFCFCLYIYVYMLPDIAPLSIPLATATRYCAAMRMPPWSHLIPHAPFPPPGQQNPMSAKRSSSQKQKQTPGQQTPRSNGSSNFTGVDLTPSGRWRAQCHLDGKQQHLGTFADEEEAARAYDKEALKRRGGYARLNFPNAVTGAAENNNCQFASSLSPSFRLLIF